MYNFFFPRVLQGTTNYCRDQRQDRGELTLLLNKPHCVPDENRESSGMCCTPVVLPRAGKRDGKQPHLVSVALPHLWGFGVVASRNKADRWHLCHLCEAACRPQAWFGGSGVGRNSWLPICPGTAGTQWLLSTPRSQEGSLKRPKVLLSWSCQISTSGDSDHWVMSGKVLPEWDRVICPCRYALTSLMSCAGLSDLPLPASEMS